MEGKQLWYRLGTHELQSALTSALEWKNQQATCQYQVQCTRANPRTKRNACVLFIGNGLAHTEQTSGLHVYVVILPI